MQLVSGDNGDDSEETFTCLITHYSNMVATQQNSE